ncbi:MAG TPA: M48 family metallopeptidase, partial [Bordetella sp.]|nr:M48 family metallopeptidase [Bordetella sp.]
MMRATYFDGRTARRHAVALVLAPDGVHIDGEGVARHAFWHEITVSERQRHGPRVIQFTDGAWCETQDTAPFDAAMRQLRPRESLAVRLQQSWPGICAALAAVLALAVAAYTWGLPWAAERAASHVPPSVSAALGQQVLESLEHVGMGPSSLPPGRQAVLSRKLAELLPPDAVPARLQFRSGGRLGANALALPSGDIVVTDELVELSQGRDELLLAVFAHELGHVVHRHGLRNVLQSAVVGTLAGWYLGDVSSVLSGAAAATLTLRYSRRFEEQADDYAAALLRAQGLSPELLATMLERLQAEQARRQGDSGPHAETDWFDSHPAVAQR